MSAAATLSPQELDASPSFVDASPEPSPGAQECVFKKMLKISTGIAEESQVREALDLAFASAGAVPPAYVLSIVLDSSMELMGYGFLFIDCLDKTIYDALLDGTLLLPFQYPIMDVARYREIMIKSRIYDAKRSLESHPDESRRKAFNADHSELIEAISKGFECDFESHSFAVQEDVNRLPSEVDPNNSNNILYGRIEAAVTEEDLQSFFCRFSTSKSPEYPIVQVVVNSSGRHAFVTFDPASKYDAHFASRVSRFLEINGVFVGKFTYYNVTKRHPEIPSPIEHVYRRTFMITTGTAEDAQVRQALDLGFVRAGVSPAYHLSVVLDSNLQLMGYAWLFVDQMRKDVYEALLDGSLLLPFGYETAETAEEYKRVSLITKLYKAKQAAPAGADLAAIEAEITAKHEVPAIHVYDVEEDLGRNPTEVDAANSENVLFGTVSDWVSAELLYDFFGRFSTSEDMQFPVIQFVDAGKVFVTFDPATASKFDAHFALRVGRFLKLNTYAVGRFDHMNPNKRQPAYPGLE